MSLDGAHAAATAAVDAEAASKAATVSDVFLRTVSGAVRCGAVWCGVVRCGAVSRCGVECAHSILQTVVRTQSL